MRLFDDNVVGGLLVLNIKYFIPFCLNNMEWATYPVLLSVLMIVTGSINTLSTKWADTLFAVGRDHGEPRKFNHPFVQSWFMFVGEFLCLIVFKFFYYASTRRRIVVEDITYLRGNQDFSCFLFLIPALLDMTATSMMYIGLVLTYASSFQMLRASSIVFVALLSTTFVGRQLTGKNWMGILLIICGLSVVGLADVSSDNSNRDVNSLITGDLLIIISQIIAACQIVYEEKYVVAKDVPPLLAVGLEGLFGLLAVTFLFVPFYYISVGEVFSTSPDYSLEDVPDALVQMSNNYWILIASLGTMISIAFFNFAGISVTKEVSATTRIILDSVRTFFIWIFSLAVGWQQFHLLQLLGFTVLFGGMCVYYNILPRLSIESNAGTEDEPITNQQADEA